MQWFKHQSDARNSLKLRKVRRKYGADGYAIYWFCLEAIAYEVNKDNLTFELKEDAETIAFELSIQEKRVEEIMHYMIDVGLFESSSNMITCMKLAESIDKSMTNSPKMRQWLETKSVMTLPDSVSACAELEKKKKRKEPEKKTASRFTPPTQEEVFEYMQERDFSHRKESEAFVNFYESKGWLVGKSKMKDWKAAVRNWISRSNLPKTVKPQQQTYDHEAARQREIEEIRKGLI